MRYKSFILCVEAIKTTVSCLIAFAWFDLGWQVFVFVNNHRHWISLAPSEEVLKSAWFDVRLLGMDLVQVVLVIVALKLSRAAFLSLPVWDHCFVIWHEDPAFLMTTRRWVIEELKWKQWVSLRDLIKCHRLGEAEERGIKKIKSKPGQRSIWESVGYEG